MSAIDLTAKKGEIQKLTVDAKALYDSMEANVALRTSENSEKFQKMIDDGVKLRKEIDNAETLNKLSADFSAPGGPPSVGAKGSVPSPAGGDGASAEPYQERKSWGQTVLESEQFKAAAQNWTTGKMDRVKVGNAKAVTSTPAQGGYFYRADRQVEIIDTARQRPFSVIDLINVSQTTVDAIEYVEMSSRTNNAAVVPELATGRVHVEAGAGISQEMIDADNGHFQENFSMKPKGDLAFALKSALVKTIAEWIPASRQILMDAPRLRGVVDQELTYMLRIKLEDMIVTANETGFVGLLNASGIQVRVHKVSGRGFVATDTIADTLRRMQTDIQLAFYEMDAYMLSPQVAEGLELEKGSDLHYVLIYDPVVQRVWRKRVAVSNALNGANAGTAIAGNFALGATLWDREDVEVRVGEPGNFFLENAVAILGELRAAFAVQRPVAFEKATALI